MFISGGEGGGFTNPAIDAVIIAAGGSPDRGAIAEYKKSGLWFDPSRIRVEIGRREDLPPIGGMANVGRQIIIRSLEAQLARLTAPTVAVPPPRPPRATPPQTGPGSVAVDRPISPGAPPADVQSFDLRRWLEITVLGAITPKPRTIPKRRSPRRRVKPPTRRPGRTPRRLPPFEPPPVPIRIPRLPPAVWKISIWSEVMRRGQDALRRSIDEILKRKASRPPPAPPGAPPKGPLRRFPRLPGLPDERVKPLPKGPPRRYSEQNPGFDPYEVRGDAEMQREIEKSRQDAARRDQLERRGERKEQGQFDRQERADRATARAQEETDQRQARADEANKALKKAADQAAKVRKAIDAARQRAVQRQIEAMKVKKQVFRALDAVQSITENLLIRQTDRRRYASGNQVVPSARPGTPPALGFVEALNLGRVPKEALNKCCACRPSRKGQKKKRKKKVCIPVSKVKKLGLTSLKTLGLG